VILHGILVSRVEQLLVLLHRWRVLMPLRRDNDLYSYRRIAMVYRNSLAIHSGRIIVVQFWWELDFVEDSAILDNHTTVVEQDVSAVNQIQLAN